MKYRIIGLVFIIGFSFSIHALFLQDKKMNLENKKILKQIKVPPGALILLEQHMARKNKYNKKDPYTVKFICDKKKATKETQCRLINYNILTKNNK